MSADSWPAWMPVYDGPAHDDCDGSSDYWCAGCRADLLAWYAAAKQCDPDFGHVTAPIDALRQRMTVLPRTPNYLPLDTDFEAAKRAAFPLPEDEADDGA